MLQDYLDDKPETITAAVRWLPYEELRACKGKGRDAIKTLFTPDRIEQMAFEASERLRLAPASIFEVKWLAPDDNPGRQFTSSFHPLDDGVKWYNPRIYVPFKIGVPPETWATVRCAQKRGDGPLGILSRDTLRVIFRWVWRMIGRDGYKIALNL